MPDGGRPAETPDEFETRFQLAAHHGADRRPALPVPAQVEAGRGGSLLGHGDPHPQHLLLRPAVAMADDGAPPRGSGHEEIRWNAVPLRGSQIGNPPKLHLILPPGPRRLEPAPPLRRTYTVRSGRFNRICLLLEPPGPPGGTSAPSAAATVPSRPESWRRPRGSRLSRPGEGGC